MLIVKDVCMCARERARVCVKGSFPIGVNTCLNYCAVPFALFRHHKVVKFHLPISSPDHDTAPTGSSRRDGDESIASCVPPSSDPLWTL